MPEVLVLVGVLVDIRCAKIVVPVRIPATVTFVPTLMDFSRDP